MFEIQGTTTFNQVERLTLGTRILGLVPMPVHCYRIGSTLIDAGPPKNVDTLFELIDPDTIEHVLLTHHHEDHVGAGARLQAHGAQIHAPQASIDWLADPDKIHAYRRRAWGAPAPVKARPLDDVVETPDGRFEVHAVPGHSRDHVAFRETEHGWLFSGDAYLPPRKTLRADEALDGFLASLATMRRLEPSRIFPGHGSVATQPQQALGAVIEHFQRFARKAHNLADKGQDASGIRRRLLGFEGLLCYYTGGHYSKQNLVDELLRLEPQEPVDDAPSKRRIHGREPQ